MTNMKSKRPVITEPDVGEKRHNVYAGVIRQYHSAMSSGFFIEAISLMESIIADRMESLSNELSASSNFSHFTLEKLLTYLLGEKQKNKTDNELYACFEEIAVWKDARNEAIHEMAKLLDEAFETRYERLEEYADEGYDLFRKLDKAIHKWRTNQSLTTK